MHGIWKAIGSFVRRADMILLSLCIAASVFGIVVISSATNVKGSAQYVRTQILALVLGIILYVFFTRSSFFCCSPSAIPEAATVPGWHSASCRFPSSLRRSAKFRLS